MCIYVDERVMYICLYVCRPMGKTLGIKRLSHWSTYVQTYVHSPFIFKFICAFYMCLVLFVELSKSNYVHACIFVSNSKPRLQGTANHLPIHMRFLHVQISTFWVELQESVNCIS